MVKQKVTPNQINTTCKFHVYRAAAYTAVATTATLMPYDTKIFDTGSNYNISTNVFTAPVNGYYQFNASLVSNVAMARSFLSFWRNGAELIRGADNQSTNGSTSHSVFVYMAANDTASIYYYVGGAYALSQGTSTFYPNQFSGYLVST